MNFTISLGIRQTTTSIRYELVSQTGQSICSTAIKAVQESVRMMRYSNQSCTFYCRTGIPNISGSSIVFRISCNSIPDITAYTFFLFLQAFCLIHVCLIHSLASTCFVLYLIFSLLPHRFGHNLFQSIEFLACYVLKWMHTCLQKISFVNAFIDITHNTGWHHR